MNLGKLAKWLRILGYDTVFYPGNADRDFLKRATKEGRVALTRKKNTKGRLSSGKLVIIQSDNVLDQLREIMDKLSFLPEPERMFSICSRCNSELIEVCKEEISGMVPDYIFASHTEFHVCPHCRGIFWPGTHIEKVQSYLKAHIQSHHP
jgi:uncharacterized protein with PIN domain